MVKLDAITQEVLDKISEGFGQSGAFNLRQNGISLCHGDRSNGRRLVRRCAEDAGRLGKGISASRTRTEQRNGLGVKPPGLYLKSYQINKYIFVLPLNLKL